MPLWLSRKRKDRDRDRDRKKQEKEYQEQLHIKRRGKKQTDQRDYNYFDLYVVCCFLHGILSFRSQHIDGALRTGYNPSCDVEDTKMRTYRERDNAK